jgi:hypothetical protein
MMRWRGLILRTLPCLLAAVLSIPAVSSADQLEDLRHQREDANREENISAQRKRYETSVKDLTPLDATRINQLFSLRVDRRQITLAPLVTPTSSFINRRANLEGFNSPATVIYCQWFDKEPDMRQFEFNIEDYPDKLTSGLIHLLWRPNGTSTPDFQMENTVQGPSDRYWRVQYNQNSARVLLIAFTTDGSNPQQDPETINLTERDFVTLRQRHPAETEKWLRPIFRRLQQNNLFAADSNSAWQALGEHWPVNDATLKAVEQLTLDLASPDWHKRRAGAAELSKLGRDGATAILRLDRKQFTVEQNAQLDEVLSRFSPLPASELPTLQNDPNFLLDCEYSDDITVRRLAAERLQQITGRPTNIVIDAPDITRTDMIEKARLLIVNH